MRQLSANRDFRLLWVGDAISQAGSSLANLAYPLLAFSMTGSAVNAALVTSVAFAALLVGQLPAGYLADTADLRWLIVGSDLIRSVLHGAIAVIVLLGWYSTLTLLTLSASSAFAAGIAGPARTVALRVIVDSTQLAEANAVSSGRGYAIELIAPVAGGLLFVVNPVLPIVIDAVTFGASAICIAFVRISLKPAPKAIRPHLTSAFGGGWATLWTDEFLRYSTIYAAGANFLTASLLLVVVLGDGIGQDGGVIAGVSVAAASAAGLAGAGIAPIVQRRLKLNQILLCVGVARVIAMVVLFLFPDPGVRIFAFMVVMFTSPASVEGISTARMLVVDQEVLGRIDGATRVISSIALPTAPLVAGLMLQSLGTGWTCAVLGGGFAILTLFASRARSLRLWASG